VLSNVNLVSRWTYVGQAGWWYVSRHAHNWTPMQMTSAPNFLIQHRVRSIRGNNSR